MNIAEQQTQPITIVTGQGAFFFRAYLKRYHLHPLAVALASHVRYLTIWKIEHGLPIAQEDVTRVRSGLLTLTGVPFLAPLAIHSPIKQEQRPEQARFSFLTHLS